MKHEFAIFYIGYEGRLQFLVGGFETALDAANGISDLINKNLKYTVLPVWSKIQ